MPKSFDQSAFIDTFKAEAADYLAKLTQGLLSLEKNPDQPAIIEELFRAAHTLKGVARMMGYLEIEEIAHHLENLFSKIKEGQIVLNASITDQALVGIDAMTSFVETSTQGKPSTVNVPPICEAIEAYVVGGGSALPRSASSAPPTDTQASEPHPATAPTPTPVPPRRAPYAIVQDAPTAARSEETIRIPLSRVNALFNLVGELVIHKVKSSYKLTNLRQVGRRVKSSQKLLAQLVEHAHSGADAASELAQLLQEHLQQTEGIKRQVGELSELLSAEALHLDPVIDELQYKVKELRMLPCSVIFEGLERLVRDIARQEKKDVSLVIQGETMEMDKKLLEAIKPCLVHLLRNAVDHGIEPPDERVARGKPVQGTILLRAAQQGGKAIIEVADDGGGINLQRIKEVALKTQVASEDELARMDERELMQLVFAPGFSTAPIITDISGRGVGMDVVRKEIEQLRGQVSLLSTLGGGTTVTIELPLTVAIMEVLLVEANGQRFGLPMLAIEEIVRVKPAQVQTIKKRLAVTLRDQTVPIVRFGDVLGLPAGNVEPGPIDATESAPDWHVVIARIAERRVGLFVDHVLGQEEVFVKGLPAHLGALRNVGGAAILGTGEVIVIVDVHDILSTARQSRTTVPSTPAASSETKQKHRILVVEDSLTTREFERSVLESQGYEVETAVDGLAALQQLGHGKFDLVVSDIEMPRMNGFEFCRILRERPEFKELPLIFITTLDKDEERRRGIDVGAQAYIVKRAFDQNNLLQTIERLIR